MSVQVGIVQLQMGDSVQENLERALKATEDVARQGAGIICLPELFSSRYFCQTQDPANFQLAEAIPGPTTEHFASLAADYDTTLILSLFEARARGLYHNTAAVLNGKEGYVGKYRKMHIPDDPRYYEKYYFAPGDLGFKSFDTPHGRIGVLVCWDQWYPEAARLTALQGAEILFYPTAIGWHPSERDSHGQSQHGAWEVIQRSHAVANGCYVVAVNRTGYEPDPTAGGAEGEGIQFWGQSFVAAPDGSILAKLAQDQPESRVVTLELDAITEQRHGWPFLRDRRVDAYEPIALRFLDD